MFPDRRLGSVGTLGSPASLAEDIITLMLTEENPDVRLQSIFRKTIYDLHAMQELVEQISKYSYDKCSKEDVYGAFNTYRSKCHLARGVLE